VFIKILYVILVLSTVALLWAAAVSYFRVKRNFRGPSETQVRKPLDDPGTER
jgi:hypothetical protein